MTLMTLMALTLVTLALVAAVVHFRKAFDVKVTVKYGVNFRRLSLMSTHVESNKILQPLIFISLEVNNMHSYRNQNRVSGFEVQNYSRRSF